MEVTAKLRSTQKLSRAILKKINRNYSLEFAKPQIAITPGQIAVFYSKQLCLGGGVIA
jgi:tRNA-specific 2-thiouridylase